MATRTQTMVQLNDELLSLLDQRAAVEGASRSHIIREAVVAYLDADRAALIDQQIIEGYRRAPQGDFDEDAWGDLGRMMTAMSADQMRQLNEEERAAGFQPW